MMKTVTTALTVMALAIAGATPQDKTTPGTSQDKKFVLDAGKHDIGTLIQSSAAFLGRNYLFSEQELRQGGPMAEIELQHRLELDAKGCEEVVSQLLYSKGFALTPLDPVRKIYQWVAMNGPSRAEISARSVRVAPEEVMLLANTKTSVTTLLTLKHVNAATIQNAMRPVFAQPGAQPGGLTFGTVGDARSLLLSGFADQVARAMRLVQDADQPGAPAAPGTEERLAKIEARLKALEDKAAAAK